MHNLFPNQPLALRQGCGRTSPKLVATSPTSRAGLSNARSGDGAPDASAVLREGINPREDPSEWAAGRALICSAANSGAKCLQA